MSGAPPADGRRVLSVALSAPVLLLAALLWGLIVVVVGALAGWLPLLYVGVGLVVVGGYGLVAYEVRRYLRERRRQ